MATDSSQLPTPNALPKKGVMRERFENFKDSALDNAMGKGDSWAKKVGYGNQGVMLDDIPRLISVLGLKLVDTGKVCVDRAEHEAYKTLAAAHLGRRLDQDFEDPE
jgi:hypothetical protein